MIDENNNFYKLIYKIDYSQNMKLLDFIEALQGLENEYKAICIQQAKKSKTQKELLKNEKFFEIAKIREGSVEFELVNTVTPLFSDMNMMYIFSETIKNIYSHLIDPSIPILYDLSKKCLENIKNIVCPILNDKEARISIFTIIIGNNNSIINNILEADYKTAHMIQSRATTLIEEKGDEELLADNKIGVYMYWDSTSFNTKKIHEHRNIGKVVIEEIDNLSPKQIRFISEEDFHFCTTKNENFEPEWQYLMYKVDVKIIKKQSKIVAYEVEKVYRNATIEVEEE